MFFALKHISGEMLFPSSAFPQNSGMIHVGLIHSISALPVVCGRGKCRILARFQMADDTWL
jgi:hypothetical protein